MDKEEQKQIGLPENAFRPLKEGVNMLPNMLPIFYTDIYGFPSGKERLIFTHINQTQFF